MHLQSFIGIRGEYTRDNIFSNSGNIATTSFMTVARDVAPPQSRTKYIRNVATCTMAPRFPLEDVLH